MISYLCKVAGVSRSGYYKYFSSESKDLRKSREDKDILSKENVLKAFNFKGRKKGARQIKMVLKDRFNIIYLYFFNFITYISIDRLSKNIKNLKKW